MEANLKTAFKFNIGDKVLYREKYKGEVIGKELRFVDKGHSTIYKEKYTIIIKGHGELDCKVSDLSDPHELKNPDAVFKVLMNVALDTRNFDLARKLYEEAYGVNES